uniref:Uncharacterized protein LOC114340653 n=1 Tax=Diabrotica virgifera virgifera TaxID=50390 RepID=A0A6P7GML6_DIAVI
MAARKGKDEFSCMIRGCPTRSGEQISLFTIPRDPSRAELWLKAANREDLLSKHVNEWHTYCRICIIFLNRDVLGPRRGLEGFYLRHFTNKGLSSFEFPNF